MEEGKAALRRQTNKERPGAKGLLQAFGKAALKLLCLLPILAFLLWFNTSTMASAQAQELQFERDCARALLAGEPLVGVDALNERLILSQLIESLEAPFETIALGSSRVMQLTQRLAGSQSFYNCGLSGADYRDIMNVYYQFERAGMLPQNMILALDPWLLNADRTKLHGQSDAELFSEFITLRLGYNTGTQPTAGDEAPALDSLLSPTVFQQNLHYALQPEAEPAPPPYAQGNLYQQAQQVKMPDGTAIYPAGYREVDDATVEARARLEATTFLNMDGFMAPDDELCLLFHRFVTHAKNNGVNVIFVLMPYHPIVYNYATENAHNYPGFFMVEPWFVRYAKAYDIPLYGSYNPFVTGDEDNHFYDGLHIKGEAITTFFPGMHTVLSAQKQGRAGSPWLYEGPRVQYHTAQRIVAQRYAIYPPEDLRQGNDEVIGGEVCYLLHRYAGTQPNATLLAHYAVSRREGIIYRWDDAESNWVVDLRFP